jgi:hypothetical protein
MPTHLAAMLDGAALKVKEPSELDNLRKTSEPAFADGWCRCESEAGVRRRRKNG